MNRDKTSVYDNNTLPIDAASMEIQLSERSGSSTKIYRNMVTPNRNSSSDKEIDIRSDKVKLNKQLQVREQQLTAKSKLDEKNSTATTLAKQKAADARQNPVTNGQEPDKVVKPKRRVAVKASSDVGDIAVTTEGKRVQKHSSSKSLDGSQLKINAFETTSSGINKVKSTKKKKIAALDTREPTSSSSSAVTTTEQIKKVKKSSKVPASESSIKTEGSTQISMSNGEIHVLPTTDKNGLRDIVWSGFQSSSSKSVGTTDDTSTVATSSVDLSNDDDDDDSCCSSVAGSLAGSWASKKSVQSAPAAVDSAKRRNSAGGLSLYSERQKALTDSKRRHSTSALNSLSLGEIQLSPFVRNTLRQKVKVSVKPLCLDDEKTSATTEKKRGSGKKVRFAKATDGKIKAEPNLKSPSKLKLTPENIKKLWWTAEERHSMKRRAQRIGFRFLSVTAKYHLAVEQLLSKCMQENGAVPRNPFFAEKDALRILINHDARGLELAMISALNLESCRHYHRCVKQSITSVLNTQAMWKCSNMKSVDEQWQMIATELRQYSILPKRFARILAEGDARIVRGLYDDDPTSSSSSVPSLCEESSLSTSSSDDADFQQDSFTI